ncbi:MAG: hypothetical protein HRF49_07630 [bacterium]
MLFQLPERLVGRVKRDWHLNWGGTQRVKGQQGKAPGIVTGRLCNSIEPIPPRQSGDMWETGVRTNVEYAAVHEYGFSGTVQVRAHERKMNQAFGRPTAPFTQNVRSHSRKLNLKERRYLRNPVPLEAGLWVKDLVKELAKL